MNFEIEEKLHKQIILGLTIRTLERDRNHLNELKMQRAFSLWFESKIAQLHYELKQVKSELGKNGVKLQSEKKVDELITEYTFIEKGNAYTRRYMNVALRNWTEEEVKRLLGMEYKTTNDRK